MIFIAVGYVDKTIAQVVYEELENGAFGGGFPPARES
jgi:hypothetical protein